MKCLWLILLTLCLGVSSYCFAQEAKAIPVRKKIVKKEAKAFLLGTELRQYKYVEPGYVEHSGLMYGVWGEWYWSSALGDGKVSGNMLFGALDYDGALCNSSNVCTPYQAKTNDVIARLSTRLEFKLNSNFQLEAGVGYRYLYDKGEGIGFYQRTGQWIYFPLGMGFNMDSSAGKFLFNLEYDFLAYGSFKSNLSEAGAGYDDLTHPQNAGYGLIISTGLEFTEEWSGQLFYESWNLDETEPITSGGSSFVEPKNNSQSYGLKLGYKF